MTTPLTQGGVKGFVNKLIKQIDYLIPLTVIVLVIIGVTLIRSATFINGAAFLENPFLQRHSASILIGSVGLIFSLFFDYRALRNYSKVIYVGNILMLLSVLVLGQSISGGQRWIRFGLISFQPSELAKLAVIITLADLLAKEDYDVSQIKGLIVPIIHVAIPILLILAQNDLGTSLVVVATFVGMIYIAGANPKLLLGVGLGGLVTSIVWVTTHLYWEVPIPLQTYQLNRLLVFIDPYFDPLGSGYNLIQSKIAIGSGQLWGKGLFGGSQNQLRFLPERHTDFIFSVLGEELGFAGAGATLLCYFILLWRGIKVAEEAKDEFGRLVVVGILSMFAFHVLENVGMTIGIMPVTGIPLPFLSYGGSAMITSLLAVGLIININMRRKKMLF